jgi:hypothetical protein
VFGVVGAVFTVSPKLRVESLKISIPTLLILIDRDQSCSIATFGLSIKFSTNAFWRPRAFRRQEFPHAAVDIFVPTFVQGIKIQLCYEIHTVEI